MNLTEVRQWLELAIGRSRPADDNERRYTHAARAALTALGGRALAMLVSIATIPLTIRYLGVERFGVWMAISTLLVWFTTTDLGLGNGLMNALSGAFARDRRDLAQRYVASTFWTLVLISCAVGLVLALAWRWVDWAGLFNVRSAEARDEVGRAIGVAFLLTLISQPLLIGNRVWQAYQEGSTANYWAAAGTLASLIGVVAVTRGRGSLTALVMAFTGTQVLVTALSVGWLFAVQKPWLAPSWAAADLREARRLLATGFDFFILQICALFLLQTDNLVIAWFRGPEEVTRYSVPYRLFSYVPVLQSVFLAPLWPAYAEAASRNDWTWVRTAFKRTLVLGMSLITLLILALLALSPFLLRLWTHGAVDAPRSLLTLMAVWTWMWCWGNSFSTLQNGVDHVRVQWIGGAIVAVLNLVLSVVLVQRLGAVGVILATVVAYGGVALWLMPLDVSRFLRSKA